MDSSVKEEKDRFGSYLILEKESEAKKMCSHLILLPQGQLFLRPFQLLRSIHDKINDVNTSRQGEKDQDVCNYS